MIEKKSFMFAGRYQYPTEESLIDPSSVEFGQVVSNEVEVLKNAIL
jgi:hypothetical protein